MSAIRYLIVHKDHRFDVLGPNSGAENATRCLARALAAAGHRVTVAGQLSGPEQVVDGVEYWDLGPSFDTSGALERARNQGPYYLISAGRAQSLLESRRDPCCRKRILITHDRSGNDTGIKPEVLCRVVDRVVCVSEAQREVFLRAGADATKVVTFYNGVDLDLFKAGGPEERDYRRLVFVGALVEDKGIHWLVEAFCALKSKYPDLRLDVYGSADLWGRSRLFDEKAIEAKVPGLKFHGKVSQAVVAEAYRTAGLCVIPSIWFDPFPLTALEAQATGCPVLTFDVGGLKEGVLDGQSALVLKEVSPQQLTSALERLLASPAELRSMAAQALELCRPRFTWEKVAAQISAVCQEGSPQLAKGRFGVLTTWNQACGLATYARWMLSSFEPGSYVVLGEESPTLCADEDYVTRCWRRGQSDFSEVVRAAKRHNLKLLHINAHPDFFKDSNFAAAISSLRADGVRVVLHLHSTFTISQQMRALIDVADRVLVHTKENRLEAIANGAKSDRVSVLPHGVHQLPTLGSDELRALRLKLGMKPEAVILSAFGFVQPHKGMDGIVEGVAHLQRLGVEALGYIVGGENPNDPQSAEYLKALKAYAEAQGVSDRITIVSRFVEQAEVEQYLQASTFVLMNYHSQHFEASGACALAVGAGAVVLTSLAPAFGVFGDSVWHLTSGFPLPLALQTLLKSPDLIETIKDNARKYSLKYGWDRIALRLRELYANLGFEPAVEHRQEVRTMTMNQGTQKPAAESPLKILMQNRPNANTQAGGDSVVMNRLVAGLLARGMQVTVDLEGKEDPQRYDLVHLFNFALPELLKRQAERCRYAGVPFVVTTLCEDVPSFHNQSWEAARLLAEYIRRGQTKDWLRNEWWRVRSATPSARFENAYAVQEASALFASGAGEARVLSRDYPAAKNISVIPFGFDLGQAVSPQAFISEFGVSDFVLCVGRIESRKNQVMLLKALEDSDLPVVFAGGGFSYQPEYEALVKSFKRRGKTLVLGRLSPEMLASAYAACRVHVLPSWYELPGLVSLEAAAFGKNVVVTDTGSTADYFGDLAFYADPSDWRSIKTAVLAAYYSPVVPELSQSVRQFTWERTVNATIEAYQRIVNAAGRPRMLAAQAPSQTLGLSSASWAAPASPMGSTPAQQSAGLTFSSGTSEMKTAVAPVAAPQAQSSLLAGLAPINFGASAAPSVAVNPEAVLLKGEEAAKAGDFAEAHRLLSEAERLNPNSARCLRAHGAVYLAEQSRVEAKRYFERSLAIDAREVRALVGLGMCSSFEGNHAAGYDLFIRALEIDPVQTTALHQLIECSNVLRKFDVLERCLRRYLEQKPSDLEFQFCLAGCLYHLGRSAEALRIAEQVLAVQSGHKGALELKQALQRQSASAGSANFGTQIGAPQAPTSAPTVAASTTVATTSQTMPNQPSWLAQVKPFEVPMTVRSAPVENTPKIESAARTSVLPPANPAVPSYSGVDAQLDLLEEKKRQHKFSEVAKEVDEILARPVLSESERERATLLRAEAHSMLEEFDRAHALFDQVLARNNSSARALCGKGALAAHQGKWQEAAELFQRALTAKPEHDVACAGMGLCAAQQRKFDQAWDWYRRAVKSNAENLRGLLGLVELAYPLGKLAELEEALRSYLDMHPADLQFVYSLAGCLYAQNKVPEAKAEVEKIIVFEPQHTKALELQTMIKKKLAEMPLDGWKH